MGDRLRYFTISISIALASSACALSAQTLSPAKEEVRVTGSTPRLPVICNDTESRNDCYPREALDQRQLIVTKYNSELITIYDWNGSFKGQVSHKDLPLVYTGQATIWGIRGSRVILFFKGSFILIDLKDIETNLTEYEAIGKSLSGLMGALISRPRSPFPSYLPAMRWPPPNSTWIGDVSQSFRMEGTWGSINAQIRSKLSARGYDALHYFAASDGFIITTPAERFMENGAPAENRWVTEKVGEWNAYSRLLQRLLKGEQTKFRVFAVVVSTNDFAPSTDPVLQRDVDQWNLLGRPNLSSEFAKIPAPNGLRVWLMVYEFRPNRGKSAARLMAAETPTGSLLVHRTALGF